jgi:hypothetical protein
MTSAKPYDGKGQENITVQLKSKLHNGNNDNDNNDNNWR